MALARNISARHAANYYEKDDYYTGDHAPSEWHGEGARTLGLAGPVDRELFASLVEGRIPGESALHRGGGARRGGTDFEFSAPKSFSIQALVNDDRRLIDVHRAAVAVARQRLEATIATRVTQKGSTRLEFTRSAVIAQFEHATSRAGDPDLHSHVVILNLTRRADGQWRSIENAEMFKEQRLMYEIYLSELAKGAKDLGYGLAIGKYGNPELAHVTREQIEHFSQRSRDVETALKSEGRTRETSTVAAKRAAALSTRRAKQDYDHAALRAEWVERGRAIELQQMLPKEALVFSADNEAEKARAAVSFAMEHLGEREAAFGRNELIVEALRAARGAAASQAIRVEVERRIGEGDLVSDAPGQWLTTRTALESERRLLSIEQEGRGAVTAIEMNVQLAAKRDAQKLNSGQRALVEHVLTSRNRVTGVQGLAGTGKTTALTIARELAEREGFKFVGLAPSHSAVRALKKSGIESQTVKRWMLNTNAGSQLTPFSVVVLDEAGLAGTSTLRHVLERVEGAGARAVLMGDTNQYESVEAGRGFAQLQEHGMQTAQLSQMVRQRNVKLAEAARLAVDQPARSLALLPIIEDSVSESRHTRLAREFAALSPADQANTLLLTGSHKARREINERVRTELGLTGTGEVVRVFRAQDRTSAQKKLLATYQPGFALRFEKDYRSLGVRRGDTAQVRRVFSDALSVMLADGTYRTMSPHRLSGKGWSVGALENLEIAVGDRIRFTGTNPRADYRNGERGVVEGLSADALTVRRADDSKLEVARDQALSLDYSYAVTGHSAQGLDASGVILDQDTRSRTTNRRSFYTDLTRARQTAVVTTDSVIGLRKRVNMDSAKTAALEIVSPSE